METADGSYRTVNILVRWHVDRMLSWVRERLPVIMETRPERGPDDFEHDEQNLARLVIEAVKIGARHSSPGPGSVNGRGSWLRDAAIVVTLGLSAWTLKTVIDQGKDIARMQCQLSPATCAQVVIRGQ